MNGRSRLSAALALGAIAGVALLAWSAGPAERAGPAVGPAGPSPVRVAAPRPMTAAELLAPARDGQLLGSAAQTERRLFEEGSLRGSQFDGSWGVDGGGRLQPSLGLRRRFDQLLSTLGEVHVEELGRLLQARAERELNATAAAEVMAVWQRYLQLQARVYRHGLGDGDAAAWEAALAERQIARRELLGRAWADAFFEAEEQALRARLSSPAQEQQADAGTAAPLASLPALARAPAAGVNAQQLYAQRSQAFGAEAAERLREEDEEARRWEVRLAQARVELARLQQAPELSALQREHAAGLWLDQQFTGGERLRARALLGL